jgi:hypothetical protein
MDIENNKIALDMITNQINGNPGKFSNLIEAFYQSIKKYQDESFHELILEGNPRLSNLMIFNIIVFFNSNDRFLDKNKTISFIISRWHQISKELSNKSVRDDFINIFAKLKEYFIDVININSPELIDNKYKFLTEILESEKFLNDNKKELVNFFNTFKEIEWKELFSNKYVVNLLSILSKKYKLLRLGQNFSSALNDHARSTLKTSNIYDAEIENYWIDLINLHETRINFIQDIYLNLERESWKVGHDYISFYGQKIFSSEQLKNKKRKKEFVSCVLKYQFLDHPNQSIKFISDFLHSINEKSWNQLGENEEDRISFMKELLHANRENTVFDVNKKHIEKIYEIPFLSKYADDI